MSLETLRPARDLCVNPVYPNRVVMKHSSTFGHRVTARKAFEGVVQHVVGE